jgi:hypothetical protein
MFQILFSNQKVLRADGVCIMRTIGWTSLRVSSNSAVSGGTPDCCWLSGKAMISLWWATDARGWGCKFPQLLAHCHFLCELLCIGQTVNQRRHERSPCCLGVALYAVRRPIRNCSRHTSLHRMAPCGTGAPAVFVRSVRASPQDLLRMHMCTTSHCH